jgi:hypothetical protein
MGVLWYLGIHNRVYALSTGCVDTGTCASDAATLATH